MAILRTHSPIWTAERKIRKLGTLKLPFEVSFKQAGVAGASWAVVYLVGKIITFPNWFLFYLALPMAITWFLTKQQLDGKPPAAWMWTVVTWVFSRKLWTCGTWGRSDKRWTGGRPLKRGGRERFRVKVRTAGG